MRGGGRGTIPGVDLVIAIAMVAIAWLVGRQYSPQSWGSDPVAYGLALVIFLPFAVRRRAPVLALAVSTSSS